MHIPLWEVLFGRGAAKGGCRESALYLKAPNSDTANTVDVLQHFALLCALVRFTSGPFHSCRSLKGLVAIVLVLLPLRLVGHLGTSGS